MSLEVLITLVRLQNNPNKLADAIVILDGGLSGFQLEGFQVWAQNDSAGLNVTFPARTFEKHGGKVGYYSYLRSVDGGLELGELLKAQIVEAFHLEKSRPPGEQRPQPARSPRAVYGGAARKVAKAPPVKLAPPAAVAADPWAPRLVRPARPATDFAATLAASAALTAPDQTSEISRTLARNAEVNAAITPGIVREAEAAGVSVPALIAARMAPAAPDPSAIALAALAAREAEAAAVGALEAAADKAYGPLPADVMATFAAIDAAYAPPAAPPEPAPEAPPAGVPVAELATVRAAVQKHATAVVRRRRKAAKGKRKPKRRPARSRARKAPKRRKAVVVKRRKAARKGGR
jgi:hypothetical protein